MCATQRSDVSARAASTEAEVSHRSLECLTAVRALRTLVRMVAFPAVEWSLRQMKATRLAFISCMRWSTCSVFTSGESSRQVCVAVSHGPRVGVGRRKGRMLFFCTAEGTLLCKAAAA